MGDEVAGGTDATLDADPRVDDTDPRPQLAPMLKLARGDALGRYLILETLGAGAMGVVYGAYDPELDRRLAVKLLRTHGREEASARLLREAQAMAKLSHPNVVTVFDVGTHGAHVYVAMEFVSGQTLSRWLQAAERSWAEVARVFADAARGLHAAHERGLVHRDFKPENVMVDKTGRVRVMDFGLARLADANPGAQGGASVSLSEFRDGSNLNSDLTQAGAIVGTPAYMAPEQFLGLEAGPSADQFSFCIALYEALWGDRPFAGDSPAAIALAVCEDRRRKMPAGPVPAALRRLVERGLSSDPGDRWPNMRVVADELERDPKRGRRQVVVLGGVVALVGLMGWLTFRGQPSDALCTGGEEALEGVWGGARRNAVGSHFQASELPYAKDVFVGIAWQLDDYAARWTQAHEAECRATHIHHVQSEELLDLKMICLRKAATQLDAIVTTLAEADAETMERADRLGEELPDLFQCTDADAVRAEVLPPSPGDVAAVEQIRSDLARVRTQLAAGKYEAASEGLLHAEEAYAALDYGPLGVEIDLVRGRLQDGLSELDAAEKTLARVTEEGIAFGQWESVRRAVNVRITVVGSRMRKPAEADKLVAFARGLAKRDGRPEASAFVLEAESDVRRAQERYDEAAELTRAALAKWAEVDGDRAPERGRNYGRLGSIHVSQGHFADAKSAYDSAIEISTARLGPNHPNVAVFRMNRAQVLAATGDHEAALADVTGAKRVFARVHGPDHAHVIESRFNRATVLQVMGRSEEALGELREVVAALAAKYGEGHFRVALAENNMAYLLVESGKLEEAERMAQGAVDKLVVAVGPDHTMVGLARTTHAEVLVAQKKYAEAEQELAEVGDAVEVRQGPAHPEAARARSQRGDVLRRMGRHDAALPVLESAWAVHEQLSAAHEERAFTAFALAQVLHEKGEVARARELAARAVELYGEGAPAAKPRLDEVVAWLDALD